MLLDIAKGPREEAFPPSFVISGNESKGCEATLFASLVLSMTRLTTASPSGFPARR
jgi:hypothetical protein